jgi:hypothetical protein
MVIYKETILTQGYKLPLNAFRVWGSVDIIEFYTAEAYSSLSLTGVKYSINKLSE